jgi:hypothetical protein
MENASKIVAILILHTIVVPLVSLNRMVPISPITHLHYPPSQVAASSFSGCTVQVQICLPSLFLGVETDWTRGKGGNAVWSGSRYTQLSFGRDGVMVKMDRPAAWPHATRRNDFYPSLALRVPQISHQGVPEKHLLPRWKKLQMPNRREVWMV